MLLALTHPWAAFGGRERQQLRRVGVALLFSVYQALLAVISHLGDNGFESPECSILWLEHYGFFPPLTIEGESLVLEGEAGKWRR